MTTAISFGRIKANARKTITGDASNRITFGITKAGKSERGVVTIGEFFMTEAGLMVGDKVDMVFFPEDGLCIIKKVGKDDLGFNLSKSGKNANRGGFSFVWQEPIPYHKGCLPMKAVEVRKDPETTRNCIVFNIPEAFKIFKEEV